MHFVQVGVNESMVLDQVYTSFCGQIRSHLGERMNCHCFAERVLQVWNEDECSEQPFGVLQEGLLWEEKCSNSLGGFTKGRCLK